MDTPAWYPDELALAGPEHLDPAYVAGYDRKAQTPFGTDLALLRGLGLDHTSTLVDFGAGTGGLALAAAPLARRVIAVDPSPAMLRAIREEADRLHVQNLGCVRAGFLSYQHQGDPADFVYSRNALHHLPDFWKAVALARIAALLRPGGTLRLRDLVYSFAPSEADSRIEHWLSAAPEDPASGWSRSELETHVRTEHSTFSWLLEPMLARAGLDVRAAEHSPSGVFAAYVCVRR